ncbi:2-nitropropane dioxygenase [Carboxydothermus islandicus]|uniref:Probable nitronate monooxygenase n=1 Tax=Carboxydothermus islandicus TaxID=661089 RepID=A0A1L8D3M5_9THEO|nr:nitronate monooxygenase [Carboxydothermus islandicus]GAV25707.1 2-nitropropane dioxygenase [Carboxydothermus islandicus]
MTEKVRLIAMSFPFIDFNGKIARYPIIQGGMAVKISTAGLAAAVANAGGIGLIAASGLTAEELVAEIKRARSLSSGIIGINIMFAVTRFKELVLTALREGIDLIVTGAGFSRDVFAMGREFRTPVVSIVSSAKLAKIAESYGAAAVVVEGKEAGGHLGTDKSLWQILPEVVKAVKIPVIAAGGILTRGDIKKALGIGVAGVQMATRFVLTRECEVHANYKNLYLKAGTEDVVLIDSPVGLPGRALKNRFVERLLAGEDLTPRRCVNCLKKCRRNFCIMEALERARQGDMENGLVFSGERIGEIKDVKPVTEVIRELFTGVES